MACSLLSASMLLTSSSIMKSRKKAPSGDSMKRSAARVRRPAGNAQATLFVYVPV